VHGATCAFVRLLAADVHTADHTVSSAAGGQWHYIPGYGAHAAGAAPYTLGADGCNPATPAACALGKELDGTQATLLRLGYSIVHPGTHILPHWGPTNDQLKAHLGLVVPTLPTGGSGSGSRCAEFTVGGERGTWHEGEAIVFDDS